MHRIEPDPGASLTAHDFTVKRDSTEIARLAELTVGPGELVRLSAPSGAGKSTLLLALANLLPFTGELKLGALNGHKTPAHRWRREVLLATHPPLCLSDNLADEFLAPYSLSARQGESRPTNDEQLETLEALGLDFPLDHPTERLSQGERSRVALARALLSRPSVLLLDEPTANLDRASARASALAVKKYADGGGRVLVAAHDDAWDVAQKSYLFNGADVELAG